MMPAFLPSIPWFPSPFSTLPALVAVDTLGIWNSCEVCITHAMENFALLVSYQMGVEYSTSLSQQKTCIFSITTFLILIFSYLILSPIFPRHTYCKCSVRGRRNCVCSGGTQESGVRGMAGTGMAPFGAAGAIGSSTVIGRTPQGGLR